MVWRNQERCRVAWSEAYECHAQKEGMGRSRGENNTQSEHEDEGYLELYIPISHTDRVRSIIAMRLTAGKRSRGAATVFRSLLRSLVCSMMMPWVV